MSPALSRPRTGRPVAAARCASGGCLTTWQTRTGTMVPLSQSDGASRAGPVSRSGPAGHRRDLFRLVVRARWRGHRVVRVVPVPQHVPLAAADNRAERVILRQQHSTWRQPGCALHDGTALIHGVHHAEVVEGSLRYHGRPIGTHVYMRVSWADQHTTEPSQGAVLAAHLDDAGRLSGSCTRRPASTPTAGRKPYGLASVAHLESADSP
jgi:hypothetical protein